MTKPPHLRRSALPVPYEVGYGKPPSSTRFRKGESGNPKGRPKGSCNRLPDRHEERLKNIVLSEAYRNIKVHDGDRQVTVSMAQAVIRSIALNAAKGQHRAQKLFADLLHRTETALKAQHQADLESAFEYKVQWERELERRRRQGITAPDPLPHPDDIEININTGVVKHRGPFTKEQEAAWVWLAKRRDAAEEDIALFEKELETARSKRARLFLEEEIARETKVRDEIVETIGIWPNRDPMAIHLHRASQAHKSITKKR